MATWQFARADACRGKWVHDSRGAAEAHLRSLLKQHERETPLATPPSLHAYPCNYCARWHVGHRRGKGAK